MSLAPEAVVSSKGNVEAALTLIELFRVSVSSPVPQEEAIGIFFQIAPDNVDLGVEEVPVIEVLQDFHLLELSVWECILQHILDIEVGLGRVGHLVALEVDSFAHLRKWLDPVSWQDGNLV